MEDLKLSVSIITYNQKDFITQTIVSVLEQKVDFKYEIIIGDDCSTDGTRELLLDYQKQYPNLIKLILHPQRNEGVPGKVNFLSTIYAAKGEYIALLDGDDYWTDPYKLQKQVDFLEQNSDVAICFHRVNTIYEDCLRENDLTNTEQKEISTFEDLAGGNFIYTASCVFRNNLFGGFPKWFQEMPIGDWVLHLLNAQYGEIKFMEDVMATYRVHSGGTFSMQQEAKKLAAYVLVAENAKNYFAPRGAKQFNALLTSLLSDLCFIYFEEGKYNLFQDAYAKCLKVSDNLAFRKRFALFVRRLMTYSPASANAYKFNLKRLKGKL